MERRRQHEGPGIREREPPAQMTTRVARAPKREAIVHHTGEQYPVKNKDARSYIVLGGIRDLRPNPPSEPPKSLPLGRNSSGGTHQSCEWEFL